MNSVKTNKVENVLHRLHADAKKDYLRLGKGIVKSIFRPIQPADFEKVYLTISAAQGKSLQKLIIDNNCKNILEFGASFGISTIYLADAARQTNGQVISTELLDSKGKRAMESIEEAGLKDYVELRIGDAMETLSGYSEPIDFLFLDGWKDLYLPLFQMLEPQFHTGTLIYADNMDMKGTKNYADYVLKHRKTYSTQRVDHGKAFITSVL